MKKIEIKKATINDKDVLIVFRYLLSDYESKIEKSEKLDKRFVLREYSYMLGDLKDKNIALFIAYYNNIPLGYSKVKIKKINNELMGHVGADFVLKEFRGQGIGKKLVGEMVKFVKTKKLKKISVELYKSNKVSLNFHKKIGFKLTKDNKNKKLHRLEKDIR